MQRGSETEAKKSFRDLNIFIYIKYSTHTASLYLSPWEWPEAKEEYPAEDTEEGWNQLTPASSVRRGGVLRSACVACRGLPSQMLRSPCSLRESGALPLDEPPNKAPEVLQFS